MTNSVDKLNVIRKTFTSCIEQLSNSKSFVSLLNNNGKLKSDFANIKNNISPKLLTPFSDKITVAIIGASSHGKTTIMAEMFPDLKERGWLITDVTDTTSQALRIYQSKNQSDVVINSWDIDEIKELISSSNVKSKNSADNIQIKYENNSIEVDGSEAKIDKKLSSKFKFSTTQSIKPFVKPHVIPDKDINDDFIKILTTKQQAHEVTSKSFLPVGDTSYTSLQLRTIIKDISLTAEYTKLEKWVSEIRDEETKSRHYDLLQKLIFIDTPGLGESGSQKDEILSNILQYKSHHIAFNLLKKDELDMIINLVKCNEKTTLYSLLESLEKNHGEFQDLGERIILAINGVNLMFGNKEMREHIEKGDHFQTILEDNIIKKLHPKKHIKPSKICFIDSKSAVEEKVNIFSRKKDYSYFYENQKEEMEQWIEPNTASYDYLKKLGIAESFAENIKCLINPTDCGQGFLIRQLLDSVDKNYDGMLVKKYLVRTNLLQQYGQLVNILERYYDNEGQLTKAANLEAIQNCFNFLDKKRLETIDEFCKEYLDNHIKDIIESTDNSKWLVTAFSNSCKLLRDKIAEMSQADANICEALNKYFSLMIPQWIDIWGYANAGLSSSPDDLHTVAIASHSIKNHLREILFLSMTKIEYDIDTAQESNDIASMKQIISKLKQAQEYAKHVCKKEGVIL